MNLVEQKPYLRFQKCYNGVTTVLEGQELDSLLSRFFWHYRREVKKSDSFMAALTLCVIKAYQGYHSVDVCQEALLTELVNPDARKVDLLYHGILYCFASVIYPETDWNAEWSDKESVIKQLNQTIELKPNIFGVGINLNKVIEMLSK